MRVSWIFAGSLLLLVAARSAPAGDPPPPPDFADAFAKARALVDHERWAEGEAALRRLFVDFQGDARVRARCRDIEDKLKLCVFRKSLPPPTGQDLFGVGTKKFNAGTRDVEFQSVGLPSPLWKDDGGASILSVRLDGAVTIEAELAYLDGNDKTASVFLCWDVEKRGGYVVLPGYYRSSATSVLSAPPKIAKVGPKGDVELKIVGDAATSYDCEKLVVSRSGGSITVKVGKTTVARANDSTYVSGYLGVRSSNVRSIDVKGHVELQAYRKIVGERFAKAFAEWETKNWRREKEIPEWAGDAAVVAPDVTLLELPGDAPSTGRAGLLETVDAAAAEDPEAAVKAELAAADAPPDTALYLHGLSALCLGGYLDAEQAFGKLVEAEPEFVPARLFRGVARFHLRRLDDAKSDLAWTLERRPRAVQAVEIAALVAFFEQDLAGADATLSRAAEAGVADSRLDEVSALVHRARTGPNFAQRFRAETDHFVVVSDCSEKVCQDAGRLLESMQTQYAAAVGPAPPRVAKSRVYVFSGLQGYMDYAQDLGVQAHSTAGVYLPMLRELMIWIPIDMTDFAETVRHEGFHQYLHRLVDDAPIWFNEGYAGFMGGGGPEGIRCAKRDHEFVNRFVPLKTLFAMRQPEFLVDAGVTYTESRYLVDFLRRTKNPKLRTLLRDCFEAASSGLSQDEVNAKVFEPVIDVLQKEFNDSL